MGIISKISCGIKSVFAGKEKNAACEAKEMRDHKTNKQIDKTIDDSFPASDPPSTY